MLKDHQIPICNACHEEQAEDGSGMCAKCIEAYNDEPYPVTIDECL